MRTLPTIFRNARMFRILLSLVLAGGVLTSSAVAASARNTAPVEVAATSAVLSEVATGEVLLAQNADAPIAPASFTKLLTLYLVFEALERGDVHLNDLVWISKRAWKTGGSKMFIEVGKKVPLEELIKGIAVVSGNDACVAVAEHLYGSVEAFVDAMNQKARELGMTHSHFETPHGLPAEGQVTTARDMAILARAYIRRFPQALRYHSMTEYTYNGITQPKRNRLLLKDRSVDGLKTGYVAEAGYHLAATAERNGMRLLAVVMGAKSPAVREREALKLLNYGFRLYVSVKPPDPSTPATTLKVWKGTVSRISLFPQKHPPVVVRKELAREVRWEMKVPEAVTAPIRKGQVLGKAYLKAGKNVLAEIPLVAGSEVPRAGFLKRLWHSVLQIRPTEWAQWGKNLGGVAAGGAAIVVVFLWIRARIRRKRKYRTFF